VATKALSYLIGVHVELEGEQLLVVSAEHDHARHRREFSSMCTRCRSCRELTVIAVLPTSITDALGRAGPRWGYGTGLKQPDEAGRLAGGGVLVGSPRADEDSGAFDQRLLHVGLLFGSDDSHEQLVELGALDVLDHRLIEMW
jgi:hypothetical protein